MLIFGVSYEVNNHWEAARLSKTLGVQIWALVGQIGP